jgi:ribosomal protein uL13
MVDTIVIDGEGAVFGRVCSFAAKKTLQGKNVVVVNSEKTVITGSKAGVLAKYKKLRAKGGHSLKGPKVPKVAFRLLKRAIRGMLPDHRESIGKQAIARVKCYNGVPNEFADVEKVQIKQVSHDKYLQLNDLIKRL